uniref:Fiber protein Fb15 n=1 Tax=Kalanchoe fedtschenkoi TaxID=63787 RepID=A0A7N0T7N5_KALFE
MALRNLYNEIKHLKVKELPQRLKPYLTVDSIKSSIDKALDNYHAKYIATSAVDPILHVCFGGMILSYLVALPEERRHLQHAGH